MNDFRPLLAFGFATPWMLWGLGLGAIPIVIHLLYRQRYRETTWAAMRFLSAALRKHSRRMRFEQWVLLAVRTAILLLVALALAGPTFETLSAFVGPTGTLPTHRILIIDASLSMSLNEKGRGRFDNAREIARSLVKSTRQGDVWNLVRVGGVSPGVIIRRPSNQPDAILLELDSLIGLEEVANLTATFQDVGHLLDTAETPSRKEVYLLTDLQAVNWQPNDTAARTRLHQSLKSLPKDVVHVFPVGSLETSNLAVTSMDVSDDLHLASQPLDVRIGLQRFGTEKTSATLELRVDDRGLETRTVTVPLGSETRVEWTPTLSPGEHRLEARLSEDSLLGDNFRRTVVTVRDRLPVLLVNGKPSGEPWGNATDLLRLALSPDERSPFAVTVIPESELLSTPLTPYVCVFVCNVALVTDREASWLSDYATRGGAVVFCMGGQVRLDQYNQVLLSPERSMLPAKLIKRVGDPASTETTFEFDPGDFHHPIVKPFQGNPNSGLELTKTFAYLQTEIPANRQTQVAMRFNTGDPAILTAPYGHGQVLLITTSVDREWGMWAVWGHSFIPLMHEIVRFSASQGVSSRQLLVGERFAALVESDAVRNGVVTLPNEQTESLIVTDGQLSFDQTTTSGFYQLTEGPPSSRTFWYAVNIDPIESESAVWDENTLKNEFPETADWKFHSDGRMTSPSHGTPTHSAAPHSSDLASSRWLLLSAFWLLLAEQSLAWRFSVGLKILAVGAGLCVLQAIAAWSMWLAGIVFVGMIAGLFLVQHRRRWSSR